MKRANLFMVPAALAGLVVHAACSDETFATAVDASTTIDAPGPQVDASLSDASADVVADAGVEAGRFCEGLTPPAAFCADFDEGDPATFGWTTRYAKPDAVGALVVDQNASSSAPASLFVTNLVGDTDKYAQAWLARNVSAPPTATRITFDYDVFLDDVAKASFVKLSFIRFTDVLRSGDYGIYLVASPGAFTLEERMPPTDGGPANVTTSGTRYIQSKRWTHVAMTFDLKPMVTVKVDLDGQPAIAEKALTPGYMRALANVFVGNVIASNVTGPIAVRFDNVVVRVAP